LRGRENVTVHGEEEEVCGNGTRFIFLEVMESEILEDAGRKFASVFDL